MATQPTMAAKGQWIRPYEVAQMLFKGLDSDRDWHGWLTEDRRERNSESRHLAYRMADEKVWYDSVDVSQLIVDAKGGRVDLRHGGSGKATSPTITRFTDASGTERVKIVTNGRGMTALEFRKLIFDLAGEYKRMLTPCATCRP